MNAASHDGDEKTFRENLLKDKTEAVRGIADMQEILERMSRNADWDFSRYRYGKELNRAVERWTKQHGPTICFAVIPCEDRKSKHNGWGAWWVQVPNPQTHEAEQWLKTCKTVIFFQHKLAHISDSWDVPWDFGSHSFKPSFVSSLEDKYGTIEWKKVGQLAPLVDEFKLKLGLWDRSTFTEANELKNVLERWNGDCTAQSKKALQTIAKLLPDMLLLTSHNALSQAVQKLAGICTTEVNRCGGVEFEEAIQTATTSPTEENPSKKRTRASRSRSRSHSPRRFIVPEADSLPENPKKMQKRE